MSLDSRGTDLVSVWLEQGFLDVTLAVVHLAVSDALAGNDVLALLVSTTMAAAV
jgi:hypothetical protein